MVGFLGHGRGGEFVSGVASLSAGNEEAVFSTEGPVSGDRGVIRSGGACNIF